MKVSTDHSYPVFPPTDPTPIFELFRGGYSTELLVASSAHFNVFDRLANKPQTETVLGKALGLERRPSLVLFTALRAMELLRVNAAGLIADGPMVGTLVHCAILTGTKP